MNKKIPTKVKSKTMVPGGVKEYIKACPMEARMSLNEISAAILEVAPDAVETVSYFRIPGYSYEGFEYNGMFAWFSFKAPFVRLHFRPFALASLKKKLEKFVKTSESSAFQYPRQYQRHW